jgi:hypothetical protein
MRLRTLVVWAGCAAAASPAAAQTRPEQRMPVEQQPVSKGTVVLSELRGTFVWLASDGELFKLSTLAQYVAPIVWFSRDEPLLRAGAHLPQPLPPLTGQYPADAPSRAYYNIPLVLIHETDHCMPLVDGRYDAHSHPLGNEDLVWNDMQGAAASIDSPPLDCLDLVKVRFFFYYTSEVGVSAHSNDFESVQVNIKIKTNRSKSDGTNECAVAVAESGHCAVVSGVFGSAHGIAWYTNGLNVEKNQDALMPITVLAEEGKHASAPDRNADGVYTPGFDVDIHPNDAWGIRDTLRTRWLQGPAFRGDMAKHRVNRDRIFPPAPNGRILQTWLERTGYPDDAWASIYTLENIREAVGGSEMNGTSVPYCDPSGDQMIRTFRNQEPDPGCNGGHCEKLKELIRGEEGCRRTRVFPFKGWPKTRQRISRLNIGGTHDEYLTWRRFFG